MDEINKLTSLLNEIKNNLMHYKRLLFKQIKSSSISTNNIIRRQIFTDLKYITNYILNTDKTKYIVFKENINLINYIFNYN